MPAVISPHTLDELLNLKAESQSPAILAGGTDLLVRMRNRVAAPHTLIRLDQLRDREIREIKDVGDEINVGAAVSHSKLIRSPLIQQHFPVLIKALNTLGSPQIRNMGTLGGNIVTASPAGDSLPPLYVLNAQVELAGRKGFRTMPVSSFVTGPGETCLGSDEILWKIRIPKCPDFNHHHFEKVGHRKSLSIAIVSMAAIVNRTPDRRIKAVRIAWGSVGKTIVTSGETERLLTGRTLDRDILSRAAQQIRREVSPISDIRASADYRKTVAGNLVLRLLQEPSDTEGSGLS